MFCDPARNFPIFTQNDLKVSLISYVFVRMVKKTRKYKINRL
jgi:hypothetical protein